MIDFSPRPPTAAITTADVAADVSNEASVRRACVTHGLKDVPRFATLPFPASANKAAGAHQLTRSVKAAMMEGLMYSDDRCTEDLNFPSWVTGWDFPLHRAFTRATTPDKPSNADMTTLSDECFRQVSRDVEEGASGPEAFNLLRRRLMTHFDRVDRREGYTRLHSLACARERLFAISAGRFAC